MLHGLVTTFAVVGFFALDSQFKIAIEKTWIANPNFWIMNYVIFKGL